MKAHIFLIVTQKYHFQIHYTLEDISGNVRTSGIPILILCIFTTASSPVLPTFFAQE